MIPATTKIRTRSTPHVETERLHRRRNFLCEVLLTDNTGHRNFALCDEVMPSVQKQQVRDILSELVRLERELIRRGEILDPRFDPRPASLVEDAEPCNCPRACSACFGASKGR